MPHPSAPAAALCTAVCLASFTLVEAAPSSKPASRPAVASTAPSLLSERAATQPAVKTMSFRFENAPINSVIHELITRFDLHVVEPIPSIPGNITMNVPDPLTRNESIDLINSILIPMGYAIIDATGDGQSAGLQLAPLSGAKKSAPVYNLVPPDAPATEPGK